MNDIVDWFVKSFSSDNYRELPNEIAGKLNELNRVERGELKMKLFNEAKLLAKHNQENLIITTNYDIVRQFEEEFEKLWKEMFWL